MSKFSFKTSNKNIPGFPLNRIQTINRNGSITTNLNQLNKNETLELYYGMLDQIKNSKKGIKNKSRLKKDQIDAIYFQIFNEKPKKTIKNDVIDLIVAKLEVYRPNDSLRGNTFIDVNENNNDFKSNQNEQDSDSDSDPDL